MSITNGSPAVPLTLPGVTRPAPGRGRTSVTLDQTPSNRPPNPSPSSPRHRDDHHEYHQVKATTPLHLRNGPLRSEAMSHGSLKVDPRFTVITFSHGSPLVEGDHRHGSSRLQVSDLHPREIRVRRMSFIHLPVLQRSSTNVCDILTPPDRIAGLIRGRSGLQMNSNALYSWHNPWLVLSCY